MKNMLELKTLRGEPWQTGGTFHKVYKKTVDIWWHVLTDHKHKHTHTQANNNSLHLPIVHREMMKLLIPEGELTEIAQTECAHSNKEIMKPVTDTITKGKN